MSKSEGPGGVEEHDESTKEAFLQMAASFKKDGKFVFPGDRNFHVVTKDGEKIIFDHNNPLLEITPTSFTSYRGAEKVTIPLDQIELVGFVPADPHKRDY